MQLLYGLLRISHQHNLLPELLLLELLQVPLLLQVLLLQQVLLQVTKEQKELVVITYDEVIIWDDVIKQVMTAYAVFQRVKRKPI